MLALLFGAGFSLILVLAAELGVRWFCPFVQFQGTTRSLYLYDEDGGPGWKPNATGVSFGVHCEIDALACRVVGQPKDPDESWLVLGDSVAFGVGVEGEQTFSGLFQSAHPNVRVLNSGVCGAGGREQLKVVRRLIDTVDPGIRRISLFYCLNDIGEIKFNEEELEVSDRLLHPENRPRLAKKAVELIRSRSKLYVLLKGLLTDPPTRYFNWELEKYKKWDATQPGDIGCLLAIADLAREHEIQFQVFVLPYVGQYGSEAKDRWLPQDKVTTYLHENGVEVVDTRDWFAGDQMRAYFLFADGCHFSERGHQLVFERVSAINDTRSHNTQ